jgi:GH24 family phage-related lysozyme (muramidase)
MAGARKPSPIGLNPDEIFQWTGVGAPRGAVSIPGPIGAPSWIRAAPSVKLTSKGGVGPHKKPSVATEIDYEALYSDLLRWEGKVAYMYLDSRGFVTVGVGNLVSSVDQAKKLPFVNPETGKTATPKEIETAFTAVSKMAKNRLAAHYKQNPSIELKDETIKQMAIKRLKEEFVPGLRKIFNGFDGYPDSAKQALVDMAYNLGIAGLKKFKKLVAAAEKMDWQEAANESHRTSCRDARNNWTRERFKKAAEAAALSL